MTNQETFEQGYKDPQQAFELAIAQGRLSTDPTATNYAGFYMYMGPSKTPGKDAFKHSATRQYLA